MPMYRAVTAGMSRTVNPSSSTSNETMMQRATPNLCPQRGADDERKTNAKIGTVVKSPAAVDPRWKSSVMPGKTKATPVIPGRRFNPTASTARMATIMLGRVLGCSGGFTRSCAGLLGEEELG
ncbi:hypothetical protein MA47_05025 [Corynebacterium auriscanis]|uniref:Uncharacterized protein n=1 Tax=Corynebacterium auriscanis TaxID=99807 RepID=A0A0A2DMH8_9CORY|nr:hypothetical protein MA47_05025 [Corynebacterium auriscanis]